MKTENYDDTGLQQLIRALDPKNTPSGRIGVLGDKTNRESLSGSEDNETNAQIGMKHELGEDGMPMRSWLRMPIIKKLQDYLNNSGAFTTQAAKRVIKEGSIVPWLKKVMIVAETTVSDGFNTGGFGEWPPSDMRFKKNHQTLIETQQLRNSVTSEVK